MDNFKRRGSLVWPVILIVMGGLLLLENLGVIEWNVWYLAFRLWPLLLIALGLDLLLGRRTGLGGVVSLLLILGVVASGTWLFIRIAPPANARLIEHRLSQSLEGADQASVKVDYNYGTLHINALDHSENLLEGLIQLLRDEEWSEDFALEGDRAKYSLRMKNQDVSYLPFWTKDWRKNEDRTWELKLTNAVPLSIEVNTGVGSSTIDLRGLLLQALRIDTGVGETLVYLPGEGNYQARISGGVGAMTIYIPKGAPIRIQIEVGIGNTSVQGDFDQSNRVYTSPDYAGSGEQIDLTVNAGVGDIQIIQLDD